MPSQAISVEDTITALFCALDDALKESGVVAVNGKLVPRSGPAPVLDDREVLCISVLQELLGFESDNAYFNWLENQSIIQQLFPRLIQRQKFAERRALLSGLMERLSGAFCSMAGEAQPPFSRSTPIRSTSAVSFAQASSSALMAWREPAIARR